MAVSNYAVNSSHPLCRICEHPVEVFLDYGDRAPANAFVKPENLGKPEPRYPLFYGFCPQCFLVQLGYVTPPELLFDDYPFLTGSAPSMVTYYAEMAQELRQQWQPQHVLEIGSNDATFLTNFHDLPHLGFEPAANVAALAVERGVNTHIGFFGEHSPADLQQYWGDNKADLIVSTHYITHIPDLRTLFAGIKEVLAPKGVIVLEDPSLLQIIANTELDQFYSEHVYVFSLPALANALHLHGLEVIDVQPVPTHGGSLRVTAAHAGAYTVQRSVLRRVKEELHLTHAETFRDFEARCWQNIGGLHDAVLKYRAQGQRVAALGASSKLALVAAVAGLIPEEIEYVSDTTPTKIGRFLPETHIPIISREEAEARLPQIWLLGAWAHAAAIFAKEKSFQGQWLTYVPKVELRRNECVS